MPRCSERALERWRDAAVTAHPDEDLEDGAAAAQRVEAGPVRDALETTLTLPVHSISRM